MTVELSILAGIMGGACLGFSIARAWPAAVAPTVPADDPIVDWAQLHAPDTLIARVTAPYPVALAFLTRWPEARAAMRVELTPRARLAYAERARPQET